MLFRDGKARPLRGNPEDSTPLIYSLFNASAVFLHRKKKGGALGSLRAAAGIIGKGAGSDFRDWGDGTAAGVSSFSACCGDAIPGASGNITSPIRVMINLGKPANSGISTYLTVNPPPITPTNKAMAPMMARIAGEVMAFPSPNSMACLLHD
jgi:hypothetical protein